MRCSARLFASAALAVLATGCTTLSVESNPPGARVLWSSDGLEPWRAWPPNSWEIDPPAAAQADGGPQTPFSTTGIFGDTVFITVDKPGYLRPRPRPVQLFAWRNERLEFELVERPEAVEARMRAAGMLYYKGRWVVPAEAGVEEYEGVVMPVAQAERLRQLAKGLLEWEGEWVTPEVYKQREAVAMQAKGMVLHKGRWVAPAVRDAELVIDESVRAIRASKTYPDLPAPRVLERIAFEASQVQLTNSTGQEMRYLFSGPVSREFVLPPYASAGFNVDDRIMLPPGKYEVVALPSGRDGAGRSLKQLLEGFESKAAAVALSDNTLWAEWPLAPRTKYSFNFGSSEEEIRRSLEEFQVPEPQLGITPPQIEVPEIVPTPAPERRGPGGAPREGGGGRPGGSGRPPR
jgi:hypothetical protein